MAVKDVFCTHGFPTTAASRMLRGAPVLQTATSTLEQHVELFLFADYESPLEATVVERLKAAGGVVVGKTNMDEFGMGYAFSYAPTTRKYAKRPLPRSETTHSHFGAAVNPSAPPAADGAREWEGDDLRRVAGGSSGGSAVAVASGMCRM